MKAIHRIRLLKVANEAKFLHILSSFVEEMGEISNKVNAQAQAMDAALKSRDIGGLSSAIIENKKAAERMEVMMQRFERIVRKLTGEA